MCYNWFTVRLRGYFMDMKERMLSGLPCLTFTEELLAERTAQQRLQFRFNNLDPDDFEGRVALLREMLGGCKKKVWMERPVYFDYGKNTYVGENFYANTGAVILDGIYTAGHPVHPEPRNLGIEYNLPVTIGDNVWIGAQSVINPGITIGSNVVIGSGSVVTKDIPDNVIAAGNPCKIIREITDEDKRYYFRRREIDKELYELAKSGIDIENRP